MGRLVVQRRAVHPGPESGVTGIETAIILISFVVVASVFAYAMLGSGLTASEKSKQTVLGGIAEGSTSLVLRGSVLGLSTAGEVDTLSFQVSNAVRGNVAVDLSDSAVQISYQDDDQFSNLLAANYTTTWLAGGAGQMLDPGERVEIELDLTALSPRLGANKEFTVQVQPIVGGVLTVQRTTPAEIKTVVDLR